MSAQADVDEAMPPVEPVLVPLSPSADDKQDGLEPMSVCTVDTVDSDAEEEDELPQAERAERRRLERDVKAILAWSNTFLKQRGFSVKSLSTDFRDGVHLINLLEVAYHERIGTYNPRPTQNYHRIDNINVAYAYMEKTQGIKLINLNPVDVANGVVKPTLATLQHLLRALTIDSVGGKAGRTVRDQLLQWAEQLFSDADPSVKVENFWESFLDGRAFCTIVEKLCPGTIDLTAVEPSQAQANLSLAFGVAEEHLGIPALLKPEDFLGRPDERAVESYVSMLVSAAAGNRKKHEEMTKKAELMAEIREAQKAELIAEVDAEKARFKQVMQDIEKLKAQSEEAAAKERQLESALETRAEQLSLYEQQISKLTANATSTHALLSKSQHKEETLLAELAKVRKACRAAKAMVRVQREEIAGLNGEIYSMHLDQMDTLKRFQAEENTRRSLRLQVSKNPAVKAELEVMRQASKLETASREDFFGKLPNRSGFLMKLRIGGFMDTVLKQKNKPKKRYFNLIGEVLYHAPKKEALKSAWRAVKLERYQPLAEEAAAVLRPEANVRVLKLVPKASSKSNVKSYELSLVDSAIDAVEDLREWTEAINNRILLADYFASEAEGGGCRELVDFVANPQQTTLRVLDRERDLQQALTHFRDVLTLRQNLLSIVLDNVGCTDDCLEVLCGLMVTNKALTRLELPRNLVTAAGAEKLADALIRSEKLQLLDLSQNNIGDQGLASLAAALADHPNLQALKLDGNGIGDAGVIALCDGLAESSTRCKWEHEFPVLELQQNLVGDSGCVAIAALLRANTTVRSLHLSQNRITDSGVATLMDAVQDTGRALDACLLASNQLSSKGVARLAQAVEAMPSESRIRLDLSHNQMIGRKGIRALLDADVPIKFEGFHIVRGHGSDEADPAHLAQHQHQQTQQPKRTSRDFLTVKAAATRAAMALPDDDDLSGLSPSLSALSTGESASEAVEEEEEEVVVVVMEKAEATVEAAVEKVEAEEEEVVQKAEDVVAEAEAEAASVTN